MEFILIAVALLCIGSVASLISYAPSGGQIVEPKRRPPVPPIPESKKEGDYGN